MNGKPLVLTLGLETAPSETPVVPTRSAKTAKAIEDAKMFVLIARRYGGEESHSFPLGVYEDIETAKRDAWLYYCWRGGKYEPEIYIPSPRNEDGVQDIMLSVYSPDDFQKDADAGKFKGIEWGWSPWQ